MPARPRRSNFLRAHFMAAPPRLDADALACALAASHGIDPRGSLTLTARFELALAEEPALAAGGPAELARLAQRLRVGETRFYRDPPQLEALFAWALPRAIAAGKLRVLSAGCATGEEAWTIAAILEEARQARPFTWELNGVDALPESVERARAGRYPAEAIARLPRKLRRHFELHGEEASASEALRAHCRFFAGDLLGAPLYGPFGLVVCRNVLIYLEEAAARRVIERLASQLTRDGVLVVARAEVPIVRRAGLSPRQLGGEVVAFKRSGAPASTRPPPAPRAADRPPLPALELHDQGPPSRVRLDVDAANVEALVARGQQLLAAGAPMIEVRVSGRLPAAQLEMIAATLRRLVRAADALGARCVAADDATARTLAALGLPISTR